MQLQADDPENQAGWATDVAPPGLGSGGEGISFQNRTWGQACGLLLSNPQGLDDSL